MTPEWIFYDGTCGFCHRWIRLVLAIDKDGTAFRFSPRAGETFRARIPEEIRVALPPSILVLTTDGHVLTRSNAILHILTRLGGVWRLFGLAGTKIPTRLRDLGYGVIARIRHRLLPAPQGLCPVVAPELAKRFAP